MVDPRILLVEDEAESAALVIEALGAEGWQTDWHDTGDAGLRAAAMQPYDVIILDRMLPEIEGTSIVRRLRAAGISVPVLMLSAAPMTIWASRSSRSS